MCLERVSVPWRTACSNNDIPFFLRCIDLEIDYQAAGVFCTYMLVQISTTVPGLPIIVIMYTAGTDVKANLY